MIVRCCKICGKQFLSHPYRVRAGKAQFCSRKCSAIGNIHYPNPPKPISKSRLIQLYIHKKLTQRAVAHVIGCSQAHVWNHLKKYGIKSRTTAEVNRGRKSWNKGRKASKAEAERLRAMGFQKGQTPWNKGKPWSIATLEKIRAARRNQKIPEFKTKPELKLIEICKKNCLPLEYTGDGAFWIGGINPDFVNHREKLAVEVFGRVFHDPKYTFKKEIPFHQTENGRRRIFEKYDWKLIVFWDNELNSEDSEQIVLQRLKQREFPHQGI